MADGDKLKIFISWSGDLAKEVTKVLHDWLPKMFDRVAPWMSEIDIEAGGRGLEEIAVELDETFFGIIVVTQANQNAPWLNFEAGALSKRFANKRSRVAPLLVDMKSPAQVTSPIKQFQAVVLDRDGITKLLKAVATAVEADWANVEQRLKWSWDDFVVDIENATDQAEQSIREQQTVALQPRDQLDMIEELLTTVRMIAGEVQELKAEPPPQYVRKARRSPLQFITDTLEVMDDDAIFDAAVKARRSAFGIIFQTMLATKGRLDLVQEVNTRWAWMDALEIKQGELQDKLADDDRYDEIIADGVETADAASAEDNITYDE